MTVMMPDGNYKVNNVLRLPRSDPSKVDPRSSVFLGMEIEE